MSSSPSGEVVGRSAPKRSRSSTICACSPGIKRPEEGLAEAIAECSGSRIRQRFRWPWQPKLPKVPVWEPDASDPTLDIDAGMCLNLVEGRRQWWVHAPVFAQVVGPSWTFRM